MRTTGSCHTDHQPTDRCPRDGSRYHSSPRSSTTNGSESMTCYNLIIQISASLLGTSAAVIVLIRNHLHRSIKVVQPVIFLSPPKLAPGGIEHETLRGAYSKDRSQHH
ncbi:hypothetical protein L195_g015180 [Trifolium pratense]|uniref:Uncharacterized protein n=1 Tax=Trifolium pratense TaxID=57577 RepID=A0A2K3MMN3_TRIPR|nr:hypothetical protein L195_g015180 [Trifolium pratense]